MIHKGIKVIFYSVTECKQNVFIYTHGLCCFVLCLTGHYGGGMGDDSSSSGGELEAGELVIDDSYTHLSKKKKKSKKSKKKKDKEKDRDKEKSGKDKKHSKGFAGEFIWG